MIAISRIVTGKAHEDLGKTREMALHFSFVGLLRKQRAGMKRICQRQAKCLSLLDSDTSRYPIRRLFPLWRINQIAGAKEKSGGPRDGAGRPKKKPVLIDVPKSNDPLAFLVSVMQDKTADSRLRIDAAKALMPFVHRKLGEGGKKDQKAEAAKQASTGRFAVKSPPPRLIIDNRK